MRCPPYVMPVRQTSCPGVYENSGMGVRIRSEWVYGNLRNRQLGSNTGAALCGRLQAVDSYMRVEAEFSAVETLEMQAVGMPMKSR